MYGESKLGQGWCLELPVLFDRLDGPLELFAQGLGEELLNGDVELLAEDDGKTGINIVLIWKCVRK